MPLLGARGGYQLGLVALSLSLQVRLPLYNNEPEVLLTEAGNSDFFDDKPVLGQGTIDVAAILAAGMPTAKLFPGWVSAEFGSQFRDRGYSTQLLGLVEVGVQPLPSLAVIFRADGVAALNDGDAPRFYYDEFGKGPTVIDGQRWLTLGLSAIVDVLEGLAVEAGVSQIVWGQRIAAGTSVNLGFSYRN